VAFYVPASSQLMWTCERCGESSEEQFDSCWKCLAPRNPPDATADTSAVTGVPTRRRLTFQSYRGTLATWEQLFSAAARFATDIGPERVLNISHSADENDGVVTVWYWTSDPSEQGRICGV